MKRQPYDEYRIPVSRDEAWHQRRERREALLAGLGVAAITGIFYAGVLFPEKAQTVADYLAEHMAKIGELLPF